jgi:hypothetical protein
MLHEKDNGRFDSVEDENAYLQWKVLQLEILVEERTRERNAAYGDTLRLNAALREVPKYLSLLVERP